MVTTRGPQPDSARRERIIGWLVMHPQGSDSDCARAIGVNRQFVRKARLAYGMVSRYRRGRRKAKQSAK